MCKRVFRPAAMLLALAGLAACQGAASDGGMPNWTFSGANDANLAAMVADPMDLAHGRSERRADGQTAALAVMRLRRDQVKSLPSIDTTQSLSAGSSSSGSQSGAGAPPEVQ